MENSGQIIETLLILLFIPLFIFIMVLIIKYCRINIKTKTFIKKLNNKLEEVVKIVDVDIITDTDYIEIINKIDDIHKYYNKHKKELNLNYMYFDKSSIVDDIKMMILKNKNITDQYELIRYKEQLNNNLEPLYLNSIIITAVF